MHGFCFHLHTSLGLKFCLVTILLILASSSRIFEQLAGLLSISSQLLPSVINLLKRLAEQAHGHTNSQASRPSPPSANSRSFRSQTLYSNHANTILEPSAVTNVESSVSSNVESSSDSEIEYSSPSAGQAD